MIATLADERRTFVARHLLKEWPNTTPELGQRMVTEFPSIKEALRPWPRRFQSIGDICSLSLSTLNLAGSVRAPVMSGKGHVVEGDAWFATKTAGQLRDYFDFGFQVSNELGVSLFQAFGYFSGGVLSSTYNRTKLLLEIAERTKPGMPTTLMQLPFYTNNGSWIPPNHLDGLSASGLITVHKSESIGPNQKKHYYWSSSQEPTLDLAKKIHRRPEGKFLKLMETLYNTTTPDGKNTIHFETAAEIAGYERKMVTRTLGILVKGGLVKAISRGALAGVEITELGQAFARKLVVPVVASLNGYAPDIKADSITAVHDGARRFRRNMDENLTMVMERYAAIPKPGYQKR